MATKTTFLTGAMIVAVSSTGGYLLAHHPSPAPASPRVESTAALPTIDVSPLKTSLSAILAGHRKIIVLFADEAALTAAEREKVSMVGQAIFHERLGLIASAGEVLQKIVASTDPQRFAALGSLLDGIETDSALFDADRLAFRELLRTLQADVARDSSLPAIKLHKRIAEDLEALDEIERNYDKEIRQIFGRFGERGIQLKREKWEDYVAHLKKIYSREQILKEQGVILPYKLPPQADEESDKEIFGDGLPPKTIAFTFDDGPHNLYTMEIAAILKQYGVPAVFFNVGRNLGEVRPDGSAKLSSRAEVSRKLETDGFVLGNHSYTHAQLSKQSGAALKAEILNTDALLKALDDKRQPLFRFPYGASNGEARQVLKEASLRSVMWNIDSLDWADPVPGSITERVLNTVSKEKRGIILFHDIHERTVKALPDILDRLTAEGYRFAGWDGTTFTVAKASADVAPVTPVTTGYGDSWAIVIGIDDYAKWPKLQYAARDAGAVRQTLIEKFGFAPDRVFSLQNAEATRTGILAAFHDRLAHNGIKKNDRIFVFFAGHGATRHLSSGRDLGYIIPADSNPDDFATDAIPMTEIQNVAESLSAKHVLFVMDACYSGLGLTRGAGGKNFLRDNARRIGRQMLTAGGADQMVADGGPNGHSVFTWTLLQGLEGKGDLNGDGLITATELAAYVAPAVSGVSQQTPAFGSLPGSEGGEFVFELPGETEFLNAQSSQLSGDAIALNNKLDAGSPQPISQPLPGAAATTLALVTVKNLQGADTTLKPPAAVPGTVRQLAQRANDRGLQHYKEKDYSAAEADFTEALKLRPDFALAANNLGFVYYKQEKYRESALWFENAIKMDPSRAIAYVNLGDAHARSGDHGKALQAWRTYLELLPNGPNAAYVRQQLAQAGT